MWRVRMRGRVMGVMVMGFDRARLVCRWKVRGARKFLRVRDHVECCFDIEGLLLVGVVMRVRGMGGEDGVMRLSDWRDCELRPVIVVCMVRLSPR